jgi:hypothetical protein
MFLGGMLANAVMAFMWLRLASFIFGYGVAAWNLELYGGLVMFAGEQHAPSAAAAGRTAACHAPCMPAAVPVAPSSHRTACCSLVAARAVLAPR